MGLRMLISRVSSIKPYTNNVIPSSAGSARVNASNPSFGIYFGKYTGQLVREHLLPHEEHLYDQMMLHAVIMSTSETVKKNTDSVCKLAVRRALQLRDWHRALREDPTIPMPISIDLFAWPWLKEAA